MFPLHGVTEAKRKREVGRFYRHGGCSKGVLPLRGVTGPVVRAVLGAEPLGKQGAKSTLRAGPLAGALRFSSSATSNSRPLRQILHNTRAGLGTSLESELRIPKQRFEPWVWAEVSPSDLGD